MPEYLSPGVYIEEFEIGAKPIEGVSTSTAAFLGETERGTTTPELVTSLTDYRRKFGGYFGATKYLPHSVKAFFDNGGKRCFITRIVKQDASSASKDLGNGLIVEAIGDGAWGNRIAVRISDASIEGFKLSVHYWKAPAPTLFDPEDPNERLTEPQPSVSEIYDNLSVDDSLPDFFEKRVNSNSNLVEITIQPGTDPLTRPANADIEFLANGDDGTDPDNLALIDYTRTDLTEPGTRRGLTALNEYDVQIIYAPISQQSVTGLNDAIISHCELNKYRFAILDSEFGASTVNDVNPRSNMPEGNRPTQYAAYYYPWVEIINPATGLKKSVPPGGFAAGIYARSDTERGVHKAPANEVVRGAVGIEFNITTGEQDLLNPRGVNVIRAFPGRGIRVWGARTLSSNSLWKYINVRRLFIFVEDSVFRGTQWVVFEPNNERLWARVRQTITQFLTTVWRTGALMGLTPEEAFFVKADRTTMTQDDIDNGRLIVIVGLAPTKPAEFVIFRFTQFTAGAEAS
ncbi:MAG: phage tail sheath family protein [bacterium]